MTDILLFASVGIAGIVVGTFLGTGIGWYSALGAEHRAEHPHARQTIVARWQIRITRRRYWRSNRREFIRTGILAAPKSDRLETW